MLIGGIPFPWALSHAISFSITPDSIHLVPVLLGAIVLWVHKKVKETNINGGYIYDNSRCLLFF